MLPKLRRAFLRTMSKLETMLKDGLRAELMLQHQLKALSEALRLQLQEAERRQEEELERRIHQNALLSTDQESSTKNEQNLQEKHAQKRTSTSALMSDKKISYHPKESEEPRSSSPARLSSVFDKYCSVSTCMQTATSTQYCERFASPQTTQMTKEEEEEAECKKKFCALPVPKHVRQPLYQEMMEQRERKRKQAHEQRREFLLSIQKPFCFQEREKEKKEKLIAKLDQVSPDEKSKAATVKKTPHREVKDPSDSELKDRELCQQVHTQTAEPQDNPTVKLRTAERTRREKLQFLYEKPSFQPKINHQVPDFRRLHKALQTETLRKTQSKNDIKCQPFCLRTSALPPRKTRMSPEHSQEPKISTLNRSKSLGTLTSLSTNTLPTYMTLAVTKRCMATRQSMKMRDSKNQESTDWLKKYQMRSQAMKKTVALHAKLLDPHSSLKEVYNEKLQQHRAADQQRVKDYKRELRDMKARVSERPYLFEQVKQKNAKALAEQTYRNELKKAGLKEQFVEENGEAAEGTSASSGSVDDTYGNDILSREENVDDEEKIEDVEERSVKSKGEQMP